MLLAAMMHRHSSENLADEPSTHAESTEDIVEKPEAEVAQELQSSSHSAFLGWLLSCFGQRGRVREGDIIEIAGPPQGACTDLSSAKVAAREDSLFDNPNATHAKSLSDTDTSLSRILLPNGGAASTRGQRICRPAI